MAQNNDNDDADATELESPDEEMDQYNNSAESEADGAKSQSISEREYRNEMEKRRRTRHRRSLNGLQEVLPSLRGKRANTAQVLKEATDYIVKKRFENEVHMKDIEELRKGNEEMEKQIRALTRQKGLEGKDVSGVGESISHETTIQ